MTGKTLSIVVPVYNEAAVLQMLVEVLPQVAEKVAAPMAAIDKLTVVSTDGAGAVPKQVIKFLNNPENRALCRGVISSGNTNFSKAYCIAGDIIAAKLGVPHMYKFELLGTPEDVSRVREGLEQFWQKTTPTQA